MLSAVSPTRLFQHALILLFLLLTVAGFAYTMFRAQIPGLPWGIVRHHYNMMAPFQNYATTNRELMAFGRLPDGEWEQIDLSRYYPYSRGERRIRVALNTVPYGSEPFWNTARALYERETKQGKSYTAVRMVWETWDKSPFGYEFNRRFSSDDRSFIAQYSPTL